MLSNWQSREILHIIPYTKVKYEIKWPYSSAKFDDCVWSVGCIWIVVSRCPIQNVWKSLFCLCQLRFAVRSYARTSANEGFRSRIWSCFVLFLSIILIIFIHFFFLVELICRCNAVFAWLEVSKAALAMKRSIVQFVSDFDKFWSDVRIVCFSAIWSCIKIISCKTVLDDLLWNVTDFNHPSCSEWCRRCRYLWLNCLLLLCF